jgi:8-oxo-(d)GTP phosphatase
VNEDDGEDALAADPDAARAPYDGPGLIEAAGGVVLTEAPVSMGALRVLIVHRPRYDDWSLPKGHVEVGEEPDEAALREVLEETGVRAELIAALGSTEHAVGDRMKTVRWFLMRPADRAVDGGTWSGSPSDQEVDEARWCAIPEALSLLSYASEFDVLRRALEVS